MRGSSLIDGENLTVPLIPPPPPPPHSGGNVCGLLGRREVCPRGGRSRLSKKLWRGTSNQRANSLEQDVRRALISWVEAESLLHLSAKYCPLLPPPRSTIAAAFSPDGKTLASTHGDHTVKITNFHTGTSLKVLRGHRRTPWVVRFHPLCPEILASGSLDHEVRLWDANTAECIGSRDFYRPIASIAFHALGEFLAVASGHKLYIWHYNKIGETSSPVVILKTRRSLRAVHFHPHGAPFLLTAEVNDLDSSESTMALATSPGYLHYPPPTIYVANTRRSGNSQLVDELSLLSLPFLMWTSFSGDVGRTSAQQAGNLVSSYGQQELDPSSSVRLLTYSTPSGQYELLLSPIEPSSSSHVAEERQMDDESPQFSMDNVESTEVHPSERDFFPFGGQIHWESPFLRGWLIGQTQAGLNMMGSPNVSVPENITASSETENPASSPAIPINADQSWDSGRPDLHYRSSQSQTMSQFIPGESAASNSFPHSINETSPVVSRIQSELAASLAAATAAELPCTVKLRIWPHDVRDPCASLDPKRCRLTIPHAVLCSEMGAHFSPCGRYLAACVACTLPHMEADIEVQDQVNPNITGAATSPTRHPISAHRVMYELRIYSLEEARFGSVVASRAIRAAHCLTSIQFSPTSEHLLLAYGRRHSSLLKSIVIDGETTVPIYTILEVYRVSDMELVRVLPSAEDEVNVACFHPAVGGGLVYGTKEGQLRILNYNSSHDVNSFLNNDSIEVPTHALEC